ncbi:hypothetical protein EUTSA_v10029249mg [Eutrema salsugineum]|uniref:PGG domain-containing protein n=1 Tax=Eutrema salsugineum TaxID=72664 RepID=V4L325_EUTSA|nr:protein ACCELERATED CELL DEATH 6 [Eutrema salsugineum]ESQ38029.1 hypothetical protein EUTSA_v10029249mg [Eutrema salsugineum]
MDFFEARLDRIEAQRSMDVSQEQWRQRYTPLNLIKSSLRTLRSRGLIQTGGEDTTPPTEDSESLPDFFINVRLSDVFDIPGEYVQMDAEMFSALSDGNKEWLEKLRNHETPMACLKSHRGDSVLHLVAAWGHVEAVKIIVSECPCLLLEPNSKDQLPLHVAAHGGHLAVVEALIATVTFVSGTLSEEKREILNPYVVKDINGDTALHLALERRYMKTASSLVNANQQASFLANKNGISPLYLAVEVGDVSLVKAMLKITEEDGPEWRNTNLASQLEGKKCLAHAALKSRSRETLNVILDEFPSLVDELDEEGRNCLFIGASIGYYGGVCNLLDRSTKCVFVCDYDGSFPIHKAVENGHMRVVIKILDCCPHSKHLLNKKGQNILHIASYTGMIHIVRHLMKSGETNHLANEQDEDGNTPLHLATIKWRPRAIYSLAGPKNLLRQNNEGLTALEIAELNLQSCYIYRERLTLAALAHSHAGSDPGFMQTLTTRSVPLDRKGNKEYINALSMVAALVATVTFAAGFTIPGGFKSSAPHLGMAALASNPRFIIFLIFDILAMQFSLLALVALILAQSEDPALYHKSLRIALPSLYYALYFMAFAFFFGMVIAAGNLIVLIVVDFYICFTIFAVTLFIFIPHVLLQALGIRAVCGRFFFYFVRYADDYGDESYQSSTQRSVKIPRNDQVDMPDTS